MHKYIVIFLLIISFIGPTVAQAAARVPGTVPPVHPLQSAPQFVQPDVAHNIENSDQAAPASPGPADKEAASPELLSVSSPLPPRSAHGKGGIVVGLVLIIIVGMGVVLWWRARKRSVV